MKYKRKARKEDINKDMCSVVYLSKTTAPSMPLQRQSGHADNCVFATAGEPQVESN